jgi:putative endonuclease
MQGGKKYFVYILANQPNGTLYVGFTNSLRRRILEHKQGLIEGFTKKYNVKTLVYYEVYGEVGAAIYREKCLKEWKREWKINLIKKENPFWKDLFSSLF